MKWGRNKTVIIHRWNDFVIENPVLQQVLNMSQSEKKIVLILCTSYRYMENEMLKDSVYNSNNIPSKL